AVVIDFGGATKTICAGSSVSLEPSITGGDGTYTYKWSNSASGTAATYNANAAGFFTLEVTDGKGCKDKDSAEVVVSANLTVTLADKTICAGDSVVINSGYSGAGYTFLWNTGETTPTITTSAAGIHEVDVANGTCTGTGSMTLTVNALPTANLGADKDVCANATATLDAGAFASWLWTSGETTQTINRGAGTYGVTVTDVNGCKDVDSIVVNSIAKPNSNVILDVPTCAGGNITFDVSSFDNGNGPYTYKWDDNSTLATLSLSNVNSPSLHFVDITDKFGCVGRDSANITIQASLGVQITGTPDTVMCAGSSITLASNYNTAGGYNLSWSTGSTADNISVNTAGLITLTVDDGNGCTGTDAMTIVVNAAPDMSLVPTTASVCSGDAASVGYDYGAGNTYLWTPGNASSAIFSTFTGGSYNIRVTNNKGCFADTDVVVNAFSKPLVDIVANVDACSGETITLQDNSGQTGVTYQWTKTSTGATVIATTPTLQITTSDSYQLKVTDANTCFNSDVTLANFRTTPVVDLINGMDSTTICGTETLNLNAGNAGAGITYLWSPNDQNTQTITVSTTGDYTVVVSNGNCSDTDKVHVKSVTLPKDVLSDALNALEANYCFAEESQGVILSAMGNDGNTYHYAWSTGETTPQITVKAEGTYVVNIMEDQCQEADAISLVDYCPTTFFIPAAFSPNYDNKNDVFKIYGSYIPNFEIYIFNRWGEVVYHSTDYLAPWNGTYMGELVQEDVYVVKVTYGINQENGSVQRRERLQKLAVLR
ncbi:MAG: gliding motility-associated C-terminal domain-containing protein, partial [Flavobacteriales bacterium]